MKYVASAADEKPSSKGWIKMTTLLECYKILEQYPDSMTKDQFYRIAHISKRHAKYLLDSGLVPCHDSGKKTRRYTIQTRDVVTFLCDREDNPDKYKAPKGLYIGNSGLTKRGIRIVSGKTENHLMLVDLTNLGKTGKEAENLLDEVNITCNKNTIPNDPKSAFVTSGVRLGTAAVTSRGMNTEDMDVIAEAIAIVLKEEENAAKRAKALVKGLTEKYPLI